MFLLFLAVRQEKDNKKTAPESAVFEIKVFKKITL